jgi:hypothetical protein
MLKRILYTLATLFLVYQSTRLIMAFPVIKVSSIVGIIILAFLINLYITGVFAFLSFVFGVEKTLPDSYYKIKSPHFLAKFFKYTGGEYFRIFLLNTFWASKKQQNKYFDGTRTGIKNFITKSKKSEWGHLLPFIIISFASVYLFVLNMNYLAMATFIINVIGNFYPIILQRHHRARLSRFM